MWEGTDCKHEQWELEYCVKYSSPEGMRCCLFIPWSPFNIFRARRREILPHCLIWVLFYRFLKECAGIHLAFIHAFVFLATKTCCLNSTQSCKMPSARNRAGKAAGKVWIKPAEKLCCRTVIDEEGKGLHRSNSTEARLALNLLWSALSPWSVIFL